MKEVLHLLDLAQHIWSSCQLTNLVSAVNNLDQWLLFYTCKSTTNPVLIDVGCRPNKV